VGRKIGIPYGSNPDTCPVRTVQGWTEIAAINSGPLFRSINRHGKVRPGRLSGIDVARVVKKLAERAGLDPAKFAGHSLRAGHATSAAIAGASERSIMNQTGHRSVRMVRRYIRDGSLFRDNSAGKLGLYLAVPCIVPSCPKNLPIHPLRNRLRTHGTGGQMLPSQVSVGGTGTPRRKDLCHPAFHPQAQTTCT
jgi:hypothetical protein